MDILVIVALSAALVCVLCAVVFVISTISSYLFRVPGHASRFNVVVLCAFLLCLYVVLVSIGAALWRAVFFG